MFSRPFRQLMQPKPLEYAQYVNDSTIPEGTDPVAIFKQVTHHPPPSNHTNRTDSHESTRLSVITQALFV